MSRTEFLANRLQEVLLDGRWIANTNLKELYYKRQLATGHSKNQQPQYDCRINLSP